MEKTPLNCWFPTRHVLLAVLALTLISTTACSGFDLSTSENITPAQVEGISDVVLSAYGQADQATEDIAPECSGMRWSILAGIGQEESHHGTLNGSEVGQDGVARPPIIGPALDGDGFAAIPDTDNGRYDNDTAWDRAVGPMQFIPSTWEAWAPKATGMSTPDPQNIFHATRAAVAYLCGQGQTDLNDEETLRQRLGAYNQSDVYINDVMDNITEYDMIPVEAPAADAGSVTEVGEKRSCAQLDVHPDACHAHEMLHEVFGGFYLSAGGRREEPGSDHGTGEAIDYMVASEGEMPTEQMKEQAQVVVQYVIHNHESLRVKGVIWEQRIWNAALDPVGQWSQVSRPMRDRHSITQNHFDHIHLAAGPAPMR